MKFFRNIKRDFKYNGIRWNIKYYLWWKWTDPYREYSQCIYRSYKYAKFGWRNYEWDHAFIWHHLGFYLQMMYDCLSTSDKEQDHLDKLLTCIELCKHIPEEYSDRYYNKSDPIEIRRKNAKERRNLDIDQLFLLLKNYSRYWWS